MSGLDQFILSGRIVDVALVFLVAETIVVAVLYRTRGHGVRIPSLLVNAGAGGSLMLALRAALTGAGWHWIAAFLVSALVFHVADLAERWERGG